MVPFLCCVAGWCPHGACVCVFRCRSPPVHQVSLEESCHSPHLCLLFVSPPAPHYLISTPFLCALAIFLSCVLVVLVNSVVSYLFSITHNLPQPALGSSPSCAYTTPLPALVNTCIGRIGLEVSAPPPLVAWWSHLQHPVLGLLHGGGRLLGPVLDHLLQQQLKGVGGVLHELGDDKPPLISRHGSAIHTPTYRHAAARAINVLI